jgi:Acyl-CoA carboxylase epsilon subunit
MIEITKGNPTADEIAALVAVLTIASRATQRHLTIAKAAEWRRSTPVAEVNPGAPSRCERRWRARCAGWSRIGPAHAPRGL